MPGKEFWSQNPTKEEAQIEDGLKRSLSEDGKVYLVTLTVKKKDNTELKVAGFIEPSMRYPASASLYVPLFSIYDRELGSLGIRGGSMEIYSALIGVMGERKIKGRFKIARYVDSTNSELCGTKIENLMYEYELDRPTMTIGGRMTLEKSVVGFIKDLEEQTGLKVEPLRSMISFNRGLAVHLRNLTLEAADALWALKKGKTPDRDPIVINQEIYALRPQIDDILGLETKGTKTNDRQRDSS